MYTEVLWGSSQPLRESVQCQRKKTEGSIYETDLSMQLQDSSYIYIIYNEIQRIYLFVILSTSGMFYDVLLFQS